MFKFSGSNDIRDAVKDFLVKEDLTNKTVVDVPAGGGKTSTTLHSLGAKVVAVDLFPKFFKHDEIECLKGDLSKGLPLEDNSADMLICQEGIEHIPNQLFAFKEFFRILKPGGRLIITAPSYSHFRARFSYMMNESEVYKRLPPNEIDDIWHSESGENYFGHTFMIGVQKLRLLARVAGFDFATFHPVKFSYTSLLVGLPFLPFVFLFSYMAYFKNMKKQKAYDKETKKKVYGEILKLNIHPVVLFGRQTFMEFCKNSEQAELPIPKGVSFSAPDPVAKIKSSSV